MTQPALSAFEIARRRRSGEQPAATTGVQTGGGIQTGAGEQQGSSILDQAIAAGIPLETANQILSGFGGFAALQDAIGRQLLNQQRQQGLEPEDPQAAQAARSLEDVEVQAILDGNFNLANQVRRFEQQPSDLDAFNAAVSLATSPADIATLSAIARGVFPRQAPSPGNVESLPLSPALQRAGQNLFGQNTGALPETQGAFPEPQVQVQPQVQPEVQQQVPQTLEQIIQANGGFGGMQQPQGIGADPNQGINFNPGGSNFIPRAGVTASQPQPVGGLSRFQTQFAGEPRLAFNFPSQPGLEPIPAIPDIQPFQPPPTDPNSNALFDATPFDQRVSSGDLSEQFTFEPGTQGATLRPEQLRTLTEEQLKFLGGVRGSSFAARPSRNNPLIPEGTPVSSINLNGQPAEVPIGIGQLFGGIQGNTTIDRPQSFLGSVGLPLPSATSFANLSAGEQDEFFKLARSQGLDPRDVQRELQNVRPSGLPVSSIRSAARR